MASTRQHPAITIPRPTRTPLTSFDPQGPLVLPPAPLFTKDPDHGWIYGHHPLASPHCYEDFKAMLVQRRSTSFAYSLAELPGYHGRMGPMRIKLKPDFKGNLFSQQRRYSPLDADIIKEKTDELKAVSFIQLAPPDARVASCPVLPSKKDLDGNPTDKRFCLDVRQLNKATVPDKYGLPRPEALFDIVGRSQWFTKIDLRGAFHQVPIHPDDQHLTTFWLGNQLWCYNRMNYGLTGAPAVLQRIMDAELAAAGLTHCAEAFLDDLICHSNSEEDHLRDVAAVLDMLAAVGLRAHPDKTLVACDALEYLGYMIGQGYLAPHESKILAIRGLKSPTNVKQLQAVLGLCNYYRSLLPDYSVISHDLHKLTSAAVPWEWTPLHEEKFQELKNHLCEPGRVLRSFDRTAPTVLYTDWSNYGMGAVLAQLATDTDLEHMVACISRSLNKHEKSYGSYHGELCAAVWAIRSFRHYLHGTPFTLITDHQPLKWLLTTPNLEGKPARWMLMVQEFDFEVKHRPGIENVNADVLSRFPLPSSYDPTGAQLDVDLDQLQADADAMLAHMAAMHLTEPPKRRRLTPPAAPPAPPASAAPIPAATAAAPSTSQPPGSMSSTPVPPVPQSPGTPPLPPLRGAAALLSSSSPFMFAEAASQAAVLAAPPVASFMDSFAPPRESALGQDWLPENWWDPDGPASTLEAAEASNLQLWETQARTAVCSAHQELTAAHLPPCNRLQLGAPLPDSTLCAADSIGNRPVGSEFYAEAAQDGLVLVELFGGLCAGLEMVLSAGFSVSQYFYSDISPQARHLSTHRVVALSLRYPGQFPASAYEPTLHQLPQDVRDIGPQHLELAAAGQPFARWMVVAGWPCEDLSPAGKGLGLAGPRSCTFFDAIRVLGVLQQILHHPPAYLLENTFMQWPHTAPQVRDVDYPRILSILGPSFDADAARFGSGAYRLRTFWTNLQRVEHLRIAVDAWHRPAGLLVDPHLDYGHRCPRHPRRQQRPPHYPCNTNIDQVEALPTLVSFPSSNAYRDDRPGMLLDAATGNLVEPNPDERERLLGYLTGTTAAPGLSEADRFRLTGQCMDANTLKAIFALSVVLDDVLPTLKPTATLSQALVASRDLPQMPPLSPREWDSRWPSNRGPSSWLHKAGWRPGRALGRHGKLSSPLLPSHQTVPRRGLGFTEPPRTNAAHLASTDASAQQGGRLDDVPLSPSSIYTPQAHTPFAAYQIQEALTLAVQSEELSLHPPDQPLSLVPTEATAASPEMPPPTPDPDVWRDRNALHFLQYGQHRVGITVPEKKRVAKRVQAFRMVDGVLQRRLPDNTWRVVPSPQQRTEVIMTCHRSTGHWGIRRTYNMVGLQYWWSNMRADVQTVLQMCIECSRARATFNAKPAELQPLEIQGLFARWSVDLLGPLPLSKRGNRYVIVMIEGFSKQVEAEALPTKTAANTAYAFVRNVLCRYGACAEVVTDQGAEFQDEFHHALRTAFIDHRTTSANHPSANGQAERMVQSLKRSLETYAAPRDGLAFDWDEYLPYILLGYRVSKQAALGFSPYELLYGIKALLPSPIRGQFDVALELKDPEQTATYLMHRAKLLKEHCAIAASNLRIAQQRDKLRYQRMRSGSYNTTTTKFAPGDTIYVRRPSVANNLQAPVSPGIYLIREVRPSGTLLISGSCGTLAEVHSTNCAPCHLPNVDTTIDPSRLTIPASHTCHGCGSAQRADVMLVCDSCSRGWHIDCLRPPLSEVPNQDPWCCPTCVEQGITPAILETILRQDIREQGYDHPALSDQRTVMEEKAAALDGQQVQLNIVRANVADLHTTGTLRYLHPDERQSARRPLLLSVEGFDPVHLTVGKAVRANRSRLTVNLAPAQDPRIAFVATKPFVPNSSPTPAQPIRTHFAESYDLTTAAGFGALYNDAHGTTSGCPKEGSPLDWVPDLRWILTPQPTPLEDPLTAAHMQLLFASVDIQACFRVADPVAQSPSLAAALLERYQRRALSTKRALPHPANWLSPSYYQLLAAKGPIDWVFLYPPLSITDLALTIAISQARMGVALWVPRSYLSNLSTTRLRLLTGLKQQRRLAVVQPWDSDYLWVCCFITATHRTRMLTPNSAAITAWTSI